VGEEITAPVGLVPELQRDRAVFIIIVHAACVADEIRQCVDVDLGRKLQQLLG
jgi:hypothetical protein